MTIRPLARSTRRRPMSLPYDVWFPLLVFVVTRALDAAMVQVASRNQVALIGADPSYHLNYSSPADPGYALIAANWDGQWYRLIAEAGYPLPLPVGPTGHVAMNTWAFYPLYPFSPAFLSLLTGLPFPSAGRHPNLPLGVSFVLLMDWLRRRTTTQFVASTT